VALTERATKARRASFVSHVQRFLRARAEHRAGLRSPSAQLSATPIVLVAVDTSHPADARQAAMRFAVSQILSLSQEFRLICLTVIASPELSVEHLLKLQEWAAPFGLPKQRLSLHAVASSSPADVIVELARYNHVDLVVLGAPAQGGRAWAQSVASAVTPRVDCSVHVVRVPRR
jgi:nucleotide-binding universal stress UspA family protein